MKSFMTENTIKNINFDYIFNEVRPITEYGIKKKSQVKPFIKGEESNLKKEFNKMNSFIENDKTLDVINLLKHVKNIWEILNRAKKNQVLDEVEIFEVKNFLIQVEKLDKVLSGVATDIELKKLNLLIKLHDILDPAHEKLNTFYIYDEYSEKLKTVRTEKKQIEKKIKTVKKEIKEEIEKKYSIKFNLKDEVLISKSQKEKVNELIKDINLRVSGENYLNIIFKIKNNDNIDLLEHKYENLSKEEEKEEFLIRENITLEIKKHYNKLYENTQIIGEIDFIIAKVNFAKKTKSVEPEIISPLEINVKGGRNLKLEKTLIQKQLKYMPIDLSFKKNVICITGANMGGKTVSLRMIGQIIAMASYGMFVPCQQAKLCLFDHIYISVGDDQSIEKGLSTFGAEIVNLKEALENSCDRCLILVDELAGGTNPREGYAITKAVINCLKNKECITVLTTHFDNVADDVEIQNLQVAGLMLPDDANITSINNINQISKYMDYRLIEVKYNNNIPKDALKIARIAGINLEVIEDAEKYLL